MANFRKNQIVEKQTSASFTKLGMFGAVMALLFLVFNRFSDSFSESDNDNSEWTEQEQETPSEHIFDGTTIKDEMLPTSNTGVVIKHEYYALSYSEEHEQAEWVAYELTRDRLNNVIAKRANNFRPDPQIETGSATVYDYKRSGYDRGHMVPAGDMGFSNRSMSQTFYMSNMSPQVRSFNGGIWRELEENIRDWARRFRHLYIVTGPILTDRLSKDIGDNRVSIPKRYFKVILDVSEPEIKAIAYIMPNEKSSAPISEFAVSINEVESQTGIDFFHNLLDDKLEEELESQSDPSLWRVSDKRYQKRLDSWNNR